MAKLQTSGRWVSAVKLDREGMTNAVGVKFSGDLGECLSNADAINFSKVAMDARMADESEKTDRGFTEQFAGFVKEARHTS